MVMSDRNGGYLAGEWPKAVEQVNLLRPDFVMTVGDFIGGYTEDPAVIARQWEEFEAETARLNAPFFYCIGNHDATNAVEREIYLKRHGVDGKGYYSFSYRGCHFIVLDSMTFDDAAQWTWLEGDLKAAAGAKHLFVFFHHPQWSEDPARWSQLVSLLPADKTTIFNGHWHSAGCKIVNGLEAYVLPATAAQGDEDQVRVFAQVRGRRRAHHRAGAHEHAAADGLPGAGGQAG